MKSITIATFFGLAISIAILFVIYQYQISIDGTELSKGLIAVVVTLSIGLVNLLWFVINIFSKSEKRGG